MSRFFASSSSSSSSDSQSSDYSSDSNSDTELKPPSKATGPKSKDSGTANTSTSKYSSKASGYLKKGTKTTAVNDESESSSRSTSSSESEPESEEDRNYVAKPIKSAADKWRKVDTTSSIKSIPSGGKKASTAAETKRAQKAPKSKTYQEASEDENLRLQLAATHVRDSKLDITPENVMRKLKEVMSSRGKKNVDKTEQVATLRHLLQLAGKAVQKIRILFGLVNLQFDVISGPSYTYNPVNDPWTLCKNDLREILELLQLHSLESLAEECDETDEFAAEERGLQQLESQAATASETLALYVLNGLALSLARLDEEFNKTLLVLDPHAHEYEDRLKDERGLYTLLVKAQWYFATLLNTGTITSMDEKIKRWTAGHYHQLILRRVEHIYCKPVKIIQIFESDEESQQHCLPPLPSQLINDISYSVFRASNESSASVSDQIMYRLCCYLYIFGNERQKSRALLTHIYYLSMNNAYVAARELLLLSHLQESIQHADVATQILYNRALVQLALCAFRAGIVKDAYLALLELFASGRQRELLAQGLPTLFKQAGGSGVPERTSEQEKIDKARLLPYHVHINLELVEAVYLVSSMLIELPQAILAVANALDMNHFDFCKELLVGHPLSQNAFGVKKGKMNPLGYINKHLRRLLEANEKALFNGLPETSRDYIIMASKALWYGDWKTCYTSISSMKIWSLLTTEKAKFLKMICEKIKIEALHHHLLLNQQFIKNVGLKTLATMFELELPRVKKAIYGWLNRDELAFAYLDEPLDSEKSDGDSSEQQQAYLHFDKETDYEAALLNKLHGMAVQLAEKVNLMTDDNEKLSELLGNLPSTTVQGLYPSTLAGVHSAADSSGDPSTASGKHGMSFQHGSSHTGGGGRRPTSMTYSRNKYPGFGTTMHSQVAPIYSSGSGMR